MKKTLFILFLIIVAGGLAGLWYWKYFKSGVVPVGQDFVGGENPGGFTPLNPSSPEPISPTATTTNSTTTQNNNTPPEIILPKLRKLYDTPIAFGLMASSSASSTFVYFTDRGVGHTYYADMLVGSSTKITNTTIPRIYETFWGRNGQRAVFRYIKEDSDIVSTFISDTKTVSTTTPGSLKASYLSDNLISLSYSPNKDKIFILEKNVDGSVGYTINQDGTAKTKIFESPITLWNVDWVEQNTIILTSNSTKKVYGYSYILNPSTSALKKIIGPEYGLSTKMSSDGKTLIYTTLKNGVVSTRIKSLVDNSEIETSFKTPADKCVWSPKNKQIIFCAVVNDLGTNFPDDWFKGKTYYTDTIWKVNSTTGELSKILDLYKESGELIDTANLTLDKNEDYLFFINRNDLTLWSLDL